MQQQDTPRISVPGYAWYALGVLLLVYVLNFLDRQILSILAQDIKADLGLADSQLGFLYGTAFALFYAIFSIPLARLADACHRGRLIALGVALWSVMTACSGLAGSYAALAATRTLVGVGEASASPAAFSLLADHFPARRRALAASIYTAGVYIGGGISLPLGGWISTRWDSSFAAPPLGLHGWQATFIAIGLPGLLLAAWMWSLREPARTSGPVSPAPSAWRTLARELGAIVPPFTLITAARQGDLGRVAVVTGLIAVVAAVLARLTGDVAQWTALAIGVHAIHCWTRALRRNDRPAWALTCGSPVTMATLFAIGMISFVIYSFSFWAAPLAIRTYGVSKAEIGLAIGLPGAVTSTLGVVCGGWLSDRWKARDPRGRLFVMMLCLGLSAPVLASLYLAPDFATYCAIAPFAYFLSALWAGSAVTMVQELVLPRMGATAGAAYLLGSTMVGLAIGPYATGKIAEVTGSLTEAMLVNLSSIPVTLLILFWISRHMAAAEESRMARAHAAGEPAA